MSGRPMDIVGVYGPMRAMNFDPKLLKLPAIVQPKLDGARCVATCGRNGTVNLQSNGGFRLDLPHISRHAGAIMKENDVWDGELYLHGASFDDIMAMIRSQDERLEFHVFDHVTDAPARERIYWQHDIERSNLAIRRVPSTLVSDAEEMQLLYNMALDDGYEGIVIRDANSFYRRGKACPALMRMKATEDSEFPVRGFTLPGDGSVVFTCATKYGHEFKARLADAGKASVDIDAGALLTVRHQGWTAGGLPRHPRALRIRPQFDCTRAA